LVRLNRYRFNGATGWYWQSNTVVNSVASGDVNDDGQKEVVTGGAILMVHAILRS